MLRLLITVIAVCTLSCVLQEAAGQPPASPGPRVDALGDPPAKNDPDKRDLLAKGTAEQFIAAIKSGDIGAALNMAELPFYSDIITIKTREALRKDFEELTMAPVWKASVVIKFSALPKIVADYKRMSEICKKDDSIVLGISGPRPGEGKAFAIVVRDKKIIACCTRLDRLVIIMAAQEIEKAPKSAMDTATQFLNDKDNRLKYCELPWCNVRDCVIKDREELKKEVASIRGTDTHFVSSYKVLRDLLGKEDRERGDKYFLDNDWAIVFGNDERLGVLIIRGKKVIGGVY
jgi:hypothetical protein